MIQSGVDWCRTMGAAEDWCHLVTGFLESSHADMLLSAAELVHEKLHEKGELAGWLRDTFQELQPQDPSVINSLAALNVPLVTTNYAPGAFVYDDGFDNSERRHRSSKCYEVVV